MLGANLSVRFFFGEDGKGWGHKRGDLKTTLIFESRVFQAFFKHFSGIFRAFFVEVVP